MARAFCGCGNLPVEQVFLHYARLSAFSSLLNCICVQVLLLWDKIVAFDSLEPIALLASALFCFRSASVRIFFFTIFHLYNL
jgi:hypothetical protein